MTNKISLSIMGSIIVIIVSVMFSASTIETKTISIEQSHPTNMYMRVEINSDLIDYKQFTGVELTNPVVEYYLGEEKIEFSDKYSQVGYYDVYVKAEDGEYHTKIEVVDTTSPVLITKSIEIYTYDTFTINDLIESCTDNSGSECIVDMSGENLNAAGGHEATITAKDNSGNSTTATAHIEVFEPISYNNYYDFSVLYRTAQENKSVYANQVQEILTYTNEARRASGLPDLVLDDELTTAAMIRALEVSYTQDFSHYRPDGRRYGTVFNDINGTSIYTLENLVRVSGSTRDSVNWWLNSSVHRASIMTTTYSHIGIGVYLYDGVYHCVQIIGK